jgi:hypothetical protein
LVPRRFALQDVSHGQRDISAGNPIFNLTKKNNALVILFIGSRLTGSYPFDDDLYNVSDDEKEKEKELEKDGDRTLFDHKNPNQKAMFNYFKRDWRPFVDRQSKRSPEGKTS